MDDKILEGTTTVGITCKDGVVFASERRASNRDFSEGISIPGG